MTRAAVFTKGGKPKGFRIAGHSGFADEGEDIVCSAVSALAQTTLLGIMKTVGANAKYSMHKGCLQCTINESDEQKRRDCELLIEVMHEGLRSIEKDYRKYLSVSEREVT